MKIGIVTSNLRQGGVTVYTDNLITILEELGHSCILYTGIGNMLEREVKTFAILSEPSQFNYGEWSMFVRDLKSQCFDQIIVQNSWAIILFKILYHSKEVTFMSHGWHWRGKSKVVRWFLICFENILNLRRLKYIFISGSVMNDFKKNILFSKRHSAMLIQNSVPKINAKASQTKSIVVPMRADVAKDHKNAFNLAIVAEDFDFVFCGEGVNKDYWFKYCKRNIPDNVVLLDMVTDMESIYDEALAILLLSHFESLPLVLIEAMSCGIPCIASDVGSIRDVLVGCGFLVERNDDYRSIMLYLNQLRNDESFYKKQSVTSLKVFEENFSFERYKIQISEYLHRI
jgi:glycosyltransferase involved in cell wall biosynthesis